ncbi:hypothetical protein KBD59_05835 [Candidatus Gracilibacteria bacterium]|nr:hypothetical protein [Candidatus Gracilibacteria bacterium]
MKKKIIFSVGVVLIVASIVFFSTSNSSSLFQGSVRQLFNNTAQKTPPLLTITNVPLGICMIQWDAQQPVTKKANVLQEIDRLNEYFNEIAFGRIRFTVQSYYEVSRPAKVPLPEDLDHEYKTMVQLCDPGIDFRNIKVFMASPMLYSLLPNAAGFGQDAQYIETADGNMNMDFIAISNYETSTHNFDGHFLYDVIAHELLHALFNIGTHANALECGKASFNGERQNCIEVEAANIFDILSDHVPGTHPSAWSKVLMGDFINKIQAVADGNYIIGANELSGADSLRIPYRNNPVCIGYNKPVGGDEGLAVSNNLERFGNNTPPHVGLEDEGCLLLELCSTKHGGKDRLLIDAHPNSIPGSVDEVNGPDFLDACVRRGEHFEDKALGISLDFNSINAAQNEANITLNINELNIDRPDMSVTMNAGADLCHFSAPFEVIVVNNSEIPMNTSLQLEVYGTDENGHETLVDEEIIRNSKPYWAPKSFTYDASHYQMMRASIDTLNALQESDEANNTQTMRRNCNF